MLLNIARVGGRHDIAVSRNPKDKGQKLSYTVMYIQVRRIAYSNSIHHGGATGSHRFEGEKRVTN